MPVKNWEHYPPNWKSEIVPRVMKRAGYKCEQCGVPRYSVGVRFDDGKFLLTEKAESYTEAKKLVKELRVVFGIEPIIIVLATSHSCHDPKCEDEQHLDCLCGRCHLLRDRFHHSVNARATWRKKRQDV